MGSGRRLPHVEVKLDEIRYPVPGCQIDIAITIHVTGGDASRPMPCGKVCAIGKRNGTGHIAVGVAGGADDQGNDPPRKLQRDAQMFSHRMVHLVGSCAPIRRVHPRRKPPKHPPGRDEHCRRVAEAAHVLRASVLSSRPLGKREHHPINIVRA